MKELKGEKKGREAYIENGKFCTFSKLDRVGRWLE